MNIPIRARMTLWFTALLTAILVGGAAFVILDLRATQTRALDRTLQTSAGEIAADYKPVPGSSESEFRDATDVSLAGLPQGRICRTDRLIGRCRRGERGQRLGHLADAALRIHRRSDRRGDLSADLRLDGQDYRVYAMPFTDEGTPVALVVATSLENVEAAIHRLLIILAVGIPVGIGIAALGGWFLAKKALRPVATMTDAARRSMHRGSATV